MSDYLDPSKCWHKPKTTCIPPFLIIACEGIHFLGGGGGGGVLLGAKKVVLVPLTKVRSFCDNVYGIEQKKNYARK